MENVTAMKLFLAHDPYEKSEQVRTLHRFLQDLQYRERIAMRLRFWENLSIQEIASALELSWDATNQLIEMSIMKLRARFDELERQKVRLLAAS